MNRYETFLKTLCLDHSYINLQSEAFDQLLPLSSRLRGVDHVKTVSGNESWEGIYLLSRTGAYFEILREYREGAIGIGISPMRPYYVDASKITEAYPELSWKKGTRTFKDGQAWFDWFSTIDFTTVTDTIFDPWVMKYHLSHRDSGVASSRPLSIDRFRKLNLELGSSHVSFLRRTSSWLPGVKSFADDEITFTIPDREGSSYQIAIVVVPGDSKFKFKSLEMDLVRGEQLETVDLGPLKFEALADEAVLKALF